MRDVRVGIMSFAHHHAEAYAERLRGFSGVALVGCADDDLARSETMSQRFRIPRFDSYVELLRQSLDAVIVCSENVNHRRHVELAAAAGVSVLCEKPLATNAADARRMIEACRANAVTLWTAHPMQFSEPVSELMRLIADGRLGSVRAIEGVNQGRVPSEHRAWFVNPILAGGGAITDHVAHLVDLYRRILGDEVAEVYAQEGRVNGSDLEAVETSALLLLTFHGGAIATIDCSWSRPAGYPSWGGLSMTLAGTKAVVDLDAFAKRYAEFGDGGVRWVDWGPDANSAMLEAFVRAVRAGDRDYTRALDGLRAVEVISAAYESAATGRAVGLDQPVPAGAWRSGEVRVGAFEIGSDQAD